MIHLARFQRKDYTSGDEPTSYKEVLAVTPIQPDPLEWCGFHHIALVTPDTLFRDNNGLLLEATWPKP